MRRIPMISGDEYDALTRWRHYRKWHARQRAKIKRRYRRRERREERRMILEGIDEIRAQGVTVYPHVAGWDAEISVPVNVADVPLTALVWQLAQLDANELGALARQLARADTDKANLLAEALWSEAMDVEHAQLQADDAAMEESNYRAVWDDSERHARIWDSIEAQLLAAQ